uniref:Ribosomal protein L23 n=1 Tax=Pterocladiophila hemisphaerica TaxID=2712948 RepID=A0A6M3WW73_9FLOR|nr:ribosomal protein L23 [Pterocladiophila hemisphaerica]
MYKKIIINRFLNSIQSLITEKSIKQNSVNKYSISTQEKLNKIDIKTALEYFFPIKIKKLNTLNYKKNHKIIKKIIIHV